ncbi:MAG: DUF7670 domain-containing protein [Limisphaerales bacterium]
MSTPDADVPLSPTLTQKSGRFLQWVPRMLGVLIVLFIGMFALDAFDGQHGFWQSLVPFLIHLIPSAILLIILVICWRWPMAGLLYIALGVLYVVRFSGRFPITTCAIVAGPPIICGTLFIMQFLARRKLHA